MANEKRLIDADALMKYINETHSYAGLPMAAHICTMELLTYAPTVDAVEVVHGQWGIYRENEISKTVYCSHCWKEFYIRKKGELQLDMMPYCPSCGAKMDGVCDG